MMNKELQEVMIPRLFEPVYGNFMTCYRIFTGGLTGEKGVENFVRGVELAKRKYPGTSCYQGSFLTNITLTVWDPQFIRTILFTKESDIGKGNIGTTFMERFLGESILLADGDKWKQHKTVLSPAFTWKHIQSLLPSFVDISKQLSQNLDGNKSILLYEWLRKATLDAIGRGGFGFDFHALSGGTETKEIKQYEGLMKELRNPIHFFGKLDSFLGTKKKLDNYLDEFEIFMQNLIASKRSLIQKSGNTWKPEDILDFLLSAEMNNSLSDKQIAHDLNTFFVAGHETTAGALHSAIHALAMNQIAQNKLRNEIVTQCGTLEPTYDDIRNMEYLDFCIKETLRLYPPAGVVSRSVLKDIKIGDIQLGKGTLIILNTYLIHRDESFWGINAEEFKPERFSNRKEESLNAYMPFSLGPRQCIGNNFAILQLKIFLTVLIQRFRFLPDTSSSERHSAHFGNILSVNPNCPLIVESVL